MPNPASQVIHPAKFSDSFLHEVQCLLEAHLPAGGLVLDPFAGDGGVHQLASDRYRTVGVEIQAPWALAHPGTIQGDALYLPFRDDSFDCVVRVLCMGTGSLTITTHVMGRSVGDPRCYLSPGWSNSFGE